MDFASRAMPIEWRPLSTYRVTPVTARATWRKGERGVIENTTRRSIRRQSFTERGKEEGGGVSDVSGLQILRHGGVRRGVVDGCRRRNLTDQPRGADGGGRTVVNEGLGVARSANSLGSARGQGA